jgi:drug/metabolite transporter (DMT)-like permease
MIWISAIFSAFGLFLLTTGRQLVINRGDILVMVSAIFWAFQVILIGWIVQ